MNDTTTGRAASERLAYVAGACAELGARFYEPDPTEAEAFSDGQRAVWDGRLESVPDVLRNVYPSPLDPLSGVAEADDVVVVEALIGRKLLRGGDGEVPPVGIRTVLGIYMIRQGVSPALVYYDPA
jgi:hypothetical protein